jgi:HD-GYP domain-containing protein (c-di-GMP phosphodiesterase class II)
MIAQGASLAVCIGLLLRQRNFALRHSIGTEKGHILKEIALEKEKKALEEKLKALLARDTRKKGAKTVSNDIETTSKPSKGVFNHIKQEKNINKQYRNEEIFNPRRPCQSCNGSRKRFATTHRRGDTRVFVA